MNFIKSLQNADSLSNTFLLLYILTRYPSEQTDSNGHFEQKEK